jgi:hypothetical protein
MSDHANIPCELLTSLVIRGIQMGEMSQTGLADRIRIYRMKSVFIFPFMSHFTLS